jgi:GNAT superfamily N-acetyltransferase
MKIWTLVTERSWPEVHSIENICAAIKRLLERFGPVEDEERIEHIVRRMLSPQASSDLIFAAEDGAIVGMLTIHFPLDFDRFTIINNLVVTEEYERSGVAAQLLGHAEVMSRERNYKLISAAIDREAPLRTHRLYERAGFDRDASDGYHKYLNPL